MAPLVVLLAFLAVADAQSVYKCQGPDGRVTYQNTPCAGQSTGDAMSSSRLTGNTVAAPKSPPPADAAPDAAASRAGKCYEDSDLREISVRMSSPSLSQDAHRFLAVEQERVMSCEFAKLSPDERRQRMDALRELASDDRRRREAAKSTITGLYFQARKRSTPSTTAQ